MTHFEKSEKKWISDSNNNKQILGPHPLISSRSKIVRSEIIKKSVDVFHSYSDRQSVMNENWTGLLKSFHFGLV